MVFKRKMPLDRSHNGDSESLKKTKNSQYPVLSEVKFIYIFHNV